MASSCSRRRRRLTLGANRKAVSFRWIGQMTVRVMIVPVKKGRLGYAKAEDRAEKSHPAGGRSQRRRVRGLRKGKKRSRGGKPRSSSNSLPALKLKTAGQRHIRHSGRKLIYMIKAVNHLSKQMTDKGKRRPVPGDIRYVNGRQHWRTLAHKANIMGIPPGASEHPGRTFNGFLNCCWPRAEVIQSDFGSMLGLLRERGMQAQHRRSSSTHSRPENVVRTVPGHPEVRIVVVDGEDEPLCPHCRDFYRMNSPRRRHCNIRDPLCSLYEPISRRVPVVRRGGRYPPITPQPASLHRGNAKRRGH